MNTKFIAIALGLLLVAPMSDARSPKRGVSESAFQFASQLEPLSPGVCWFYNWGPQPNSDEVANYEDMEFCPMAWNGGYNATAIRNYFNKYPQAKYILGFNEPNFINQADMTPQEAAEKWPELKALADELGAKIVAPAMNTSPNPPYQSPTKWFDEFVAIVGLDSFDYLAVHSYGGTEAMKNIATSFHDRYGKDVWVTEFCLWPDEGNANAYVSPDSQISSMIRSLEWLEKTPWIYRYAWFKPVGLVNSNKGPNYGLLMPKNGAGPRELSEQGYVYTYMSEFDADVWHSTGELVAASEYISSTALSLGKGANADCPLPIEISQFNASATADYQFDITAAGNYSLELTVSGEGEPKRYDPTLSIVAVNTDGSEGKELHAAKDFVLTGDNTAYSTVNFPITLQAGKQTLRIKDANPYRPSGIRISTLRLRDLSGVTDVTVENENRLVDVVNAAGITVRRGVEASHATEGLPAGFYIAGGRKTIVR